MSLSILGDVIIKRTGTLKRMNQGLIRQNLIGPRTISKDDYNHLFLTPVGGPKAVTLPDATTLPNGWSITISCEVTPAVIVVRRHGGSLLQFVQRGQTYQFVLVRNNTLVGVWGSIPLFNTLPDTPTTMAVDLTGQTASITVASFVAPANPTLYCISGYVNYISGASSVNYYVTYTDANGGSAFHFLVTGVTGYATGVPFTVMPQTGSTVTISTFVGLGLNNYDVGVRVTQL